MKVITTVVGELGTNCYLLIDEATRESKRRQANCSNEQ